MEGDVPSKSAVIEASRAPERAAEILSKPHVAKQNYLKVREFLLVLLRSDWLQNWGFRANETASDVRGAALPGARPFGLLRRTQAAT